MRRWHSLCLCLGLRNARLMLMELLNVYVLRVGHSELRGCWLEVRGYRIREERRRAAGVWCKGEAR